MFSENNMIPYSWRLLVTLFVLVVAPGCARIVRPVSPPAPQQVQTVKAELAYGVDVTQFDEIERFEIMDQIEKAARGSVQQGDDYQLILTVTELFRQNINWRPRITRVVLECALVDNRGVRKTFTGTGQNGLHDRYHATYQAAQEALDEIVRKMRLASDSTADKVPK